ncbi:S8 family serine peptidase [Neobacillus sp.]|uniref:S8 family serine peptidase n=1 Tax=Neobacillus sp. TaxID=2675273 RepID=UPI00289A8B82|nr:S8 family serine peptidase [Neobacillus sp.]
MKRKKQPHMRLFNIVAALLMVFSLITPGLANAKSIERSSRYVNDSQTAAKEKMSNRLLAKFKKDDKVTFLIKFKEKADTTKAIKQTKALAKQEKLSANKEKFMQRSAVVSELKATAHEEQQNVVKYLEQEVHRGNVESFKAYFIVNGMAVTATKEVAEKIATFSEVEKVLPNETRQLFVSTTKEKSPNVNLANVEWNVERVGAPALWEKGIDGTGVVVASIDSGVQWDHPALKEKYRGYNAATGEVNHDFNWFDATAGKSVPYDDLAHGTHVTGTMVGSEPNGSNKIGVAPGAKWIAVKAFSETSGSDANLLAAAEWILAPKDAKGNTRVDMAPDIVNNSWGGGPGLDEWYRDVVREWRNAGIFPTFSAGNTSMSNNGGPGSVANPANYPEAFAVGATDSNDIVGDFSLRGPSPYGEIKPDISAPGANIRSSIPQSDYEGGWDGTSMAAPAVSAIVALLYQVDASLSVDKIEEILLKTATPLTDKEYPESPNDGYGYGLVNAYNAVSSIREGLGALEGKVVQTVEDADMPIRGKVSVLESRQYVNTNPENGTYKLAHAIGKYTVQAEAYGYQSKQQLVTFEKDKVLQADFTMKEIPKGTVSGVITDEKSGEAVEGVTLLLMEDANIAPVSTDKDGKYTITAYEGTYTMRAMRIGYHSQDVKMTINGDSQVLDIALKPFFTYPGGEIGYDNGIVDSGSMYYGGGAGWAVKMSLPKNKKSAIVTDGVFHFKNKKYSDTVGTEFNVEVWDASGRDGLPGKKLAGPIAAEAVLDDWTVVDLTDYNIKVDGDFYMVYVQTLNYPIALGLATDNGNPYTERSYQYLDGEFYPAFVEDGNYMIRARVSYEIDNPVITSPKQDEIFKDENIIVEGTASPTTTIKLMNNNKEVGTAKVGDEGKFTIPTKMTEGENRLIAVSMLNGKLTGESDLVTVSLIKEKPVITSPKQDEVFKDENIIVEGTASPTTTIKLMNNNKEVGTAKVGDEGKFTIPTKMTEGENRLIAVSMLNGKLTGESVPVTVSLIKEKPVIKDLKPAINQNVFPGEKVEISFRSNVIGGEANFEVKLPVQKNTQSSSKNKMEEVEPGVYKGVWTVPDEKIQDVIIEVELTDAAGKKVTQEAQGKLTINQTEVPVEEVKTGWKSEDGNLYYYDSKGNKVTGWEKVDAKWYYFDKSGIIQTGWLKDGAKWYHLDKSGAMQTGWLKDGAKWYYLDKSGAMQTGWLKDGAKWYHLDKSGAMQMGWLKDGVKWYYLEKSGAMQTGWLKDGVKWYYLDKSGAMQTGWLKDSAKWYYLNNSGTMQTGWVTISGKRYFFNSSGVWAK